jgi:CHAD domain-containing protein
MSAALRQRTAATRQARRILRKQVRKGLKNLDSGRTASDSDIHDARKRIKRARATLRMMRGALSRGDYRREDRALRAAAHPLSVARDAKILVEALDELSERYSGNGQLSGTGGFRRALVRQRGEARSRVVRHDAQLARRCMRRARKRANRWSLDHRGWRAVVHGVTRIYSRGREALAAVRHEATVERLHAWRKQAKYLYLQLELLAEVCHPAVGRLAREFQSLSEDLGDDHDLAVLRDMVAARMGEFSDEASATSLTLHIERARSGLQRRALSRGARLYRPAPERFARRLETRRDQHRVH